MNWKRNIIYAGYCFVATLSAEFGLVLIEGAIEMSHVEIPDWAGVFKNIIIWIILIAIFAHMFKENPDNTYVDALVVAVCLWLFFLPVDLLIIKVQFAEWVSRFAIYFSVSFIGPIAGKVLGGRRERHTS